MAWALNATPTAGAGTVSVPANAQFNTATTLTGVGTAFAAGNVGQMIIIGNFAARINAVASATSITLDRAPQMAISGATYSTVSGTVRVVQTGTDTSTTGLSAIAGVQTRTLSEHTEYVIPYLMQIDGTWTQTYREKLSMVRRVNSPDWLPVNDSGEIVVNGTWNWGEFVTINSVTVARETLPLTFSQQVISAWQNTQRNSVVVNAAGRLNWIGARIKASTLFWINGGYFFGREVIVDRQETNMSNDQQFRFLNGATIDIIGIKVYRGCFTVDSRNTPINVVNFKGYEPIHVAKAMTWSGVANSYTITDGTVSTPVGGRLVLEDYNGRGCTLDHGTWVNGLADFVNPVNGTNITSAAHLGGQFASEGHTRVYSSARFNHSLPNGTALQNVITYMADNATGADIPYNLTLKYALTSDASGNSEGQFLTGYRYVPKNANQIIRPTIRRSISQSDDIYTFYHGGYDIIPFASSNNLIGSGQKQFAYTDALDANVTLSRAAALALLGTKFTISGSTITVLQNANYDELYDATKAFKFQGTTAAFETPTVSSLILTPSGSNLTAFAGLTLAVNNGVTLNEGDKFKSVAFTTVNLNTSGQITGLYSAGGVSNKILEINGVTNGSSLYVGNNATGITTLYQDDTNQATYRVYFAPGTTPAQLVARELYPFQRSAQVVTLVDGLNVVNLVDIPDVGITQEDLATVQAYTSIEIPSKFYDRTAAFRLTEQGIKLGQMVARSGTALEIGNFSHLINKDATLVYSVTGSVITTKSTAYAGDDRYQTEIANPPATIEANTTEVITIAIQDANGDSQVSINGGDGEFELWKVTTATATADYETGTLLDTVGNGIYRFIGVSGFDIVGVDTNSNIRRRSSMAKGIYTQAFYVGDQIQLAQAPQVIENGVKLDVIKVELAEVRAKTDNLPTAPAAVGDAMTLDASYDAAKTASTQSSVDALSVATGTPLQAGDYVAPSNADIASIKATVEAIEPTDISTLATAAQVTALGTPLQADEYIAPDNEDIAAIKAKTDTLTNAPTAADVADAVRTELATELDRLDVVVSSRSTLTAGDIPEGLTAADVWSADNRTLTEAAGLTSEQAQQLAALPTLAEIEATTVLAKAEQVEVLGTPLQAEDYTAPANAEVANIKQISIEIQTRVDAALGAPH